MAAFDELPDEVRRIAEQYLSALDSSAAELVSAPLHDTEELRAVLQRCETIRHALTPVFELRYEQALESIQSDWIDDSADFQLAGEADVVPDAIDHYKVIESLEKGGQGWTFRVVDTRVAGADLVVKLSREVVDETEPWKSRFAGEAQRLFQLHHDCLPRVRGVGTYERRPYIVMDYIPGRTLEHFVSVERLSFDRVVDVITRLAKTLGYIHQQGMVHCDVKPRNVVIDSAGKVWLIDFGLAVMKHQAYSGLELNTRIGGTASYMSPEQAHGTLDAVDQRSDLFGLGALMYALLVGRPPYVANHPRELWKLASRCEFDQAAFGSDVPDRIRKVCLKAMGCSPAERFQSAAEMVEALEASTATRFSRRKVAGVLLLSVPLILLYAAQRLARNRAVLKRLQVKVWRGELAGWSELRFVAPMRTQDLIQIQVDVAQTNRVPNEHVQAVWLAADGICHEIDFVDPQHGEKDSLRLFWPAADSRRQASGSTGTELILLYSGPKVLSEVVPRHFAQPMETLADRELFEISDDGVQHHSLRGPGKVVVATPTNDLQSRLEALHGELAAAGSLAGVVFSFRN